MESPKDMTPATAPAPAPEAGGSGVADPLASLHKMSRTAGLGSQEYVEVNTLAVASVVLGLLSVLAVFFGTIFLFVPVVALVVGLVGMWQVSRSAGTQTGKGVAVLGILIALGFVATVGGRAYLHSRDVLREQNSIVQLIQDFGGDISRGDYDAAWLKLGTKIQEVTKKEDFALWWTRAQSSSYYGKVQWMRWNGILDVKEDPDTGDKIAYGVILVQFAVDQNRLPSTFRKTDHGWVIEDLQLNFSPTAVQPHASP